MPDINPQFNSNPHQSSPAVPAKNTLASSELLKFEALLEDLRGQEDPTQLPPKGQTAKAVAQQTGAADPQTSNLDALEDSHIVTRKIAQSLHGLEELESELGLLDNIGQVAHSPLLTEHLLAESVLEYSRDAIAVLQGSKVLYCNSLAEALLSFNREQHVGLNLVRIIRQNFQVPRKLLKETIRLSLIHI